jgi:hypothetical protein
MQYKKPGIYSEFLVFIRALFQTINLSERFNFIISITTRLMERVYGIGHKMCLILYDFFLFWIVRLLALRPLLAYCASLG